MNISDLDNLGPKSQENLAQAGIHTLAQLRARGSVRAYIQIKRAGTRRTFIDSQRSDVRRPARATEGIVRRPRKRNTGTLRISAGTKVQSSVVGKIGADGKRVSRYGPGTRSLAARCGRNDESQSGEGDGVRDGAGS